MTRRQKSIEKTYSWAYLSKLNEKVVLYFLIKWKILSLTAFFDMKSSDTLPTQDTCISAKN